MSLRTESSAIPTLLCRVSKWTVVTASSARDKEVNEPGDKGSLYRKHSPADRRLLEHDVLLWAGGATPTWSTAANAIDIVSLYYDGSSWFGAGNTGFA